MKQPFPFSAIVGQNDIKQSLILTAIDPSIGGVLIFGDRGTGKSTAVRALAALLPPIKAVENCPYNCETITGPCNYCQQGRSAKRITKPTPVIDPPLGATQDRVAGALDIERALTKGEKAFEPGLLAAAHRGYLYIDEVNLLEDHIVDLLLDAAASGENVIERDGLSIRHATRFVLVGSGNPEEGELRPQLLDRFGLSIEVGSPDTVAERIEVVRRRDAYENDYDQFIATWQAGDEKIRKAIVSARKRLAKIDVGDDILEDCAALCIALGADGLRGELTLLRTLRALTAYERKKAPNRAMIKRIAPSALRHRLRRDPLDEAGSTARIERALEEVFAK